MPALAGTLGNVGMRAVGRRYDDCVNVGVGEDVVKGWECSDAQFGGLLSERRLSAGVDSNEPAGVELGDGVYVDATNDAGGAYDSESYCVHFFLTCCTGHLQIGQTM